MFFDQGAIVSDIIIIFWGLLFIGLVVFFMASSLPFAFYMSLFVLALQPAAMAVEPPYSALIALIAPIAVYKLGVVSKVEIWLVQNNVSRTLLLIAHTAAGVMAGRILGALAHVIISPSTQLATFEILGAILIAYVNYGSFLKRYGLSLFECLSPNVVINQRIITA